MEYIRHKFIMPYNPLQPYNDLPALDPELLFVDEDLSKLVLKASRSLAELKGLCLALPDPQILIQTLVVQESRDSSAIENIVDLCTKEIHPLAKNAKDIGSTAVMFTIGLHVVCWILILLS